MKTLLLVATLALAGCAAQRPCGQPAAEQPEPMVAGFEAPHFPADWCGRWKGLGHVNVAGTNKTALYMELEIRPITRADGSSPPDAAAEHKDARPDDRYTWTITYSDPTGKTPPQTRPYEVVVVDGNGGRFRVDEKNGIVLPLHDMMGPLYSAFSVGDLHLVARYAMDPFGPKATISVEILTLPKDRTGVTGAEPNLVEFREPRTLQNVVLVRQK